MKRYYLRVGDIKMELPGDFALWREDAGFRSEELLGHPLRHVGTATQTITLDEEGITSVVCVQPSK